MSPIHILGTGAVGFPLAAFLSAQGREVVAVRARERGEVPGESAVAVIGDGGRLSARVPTVGLDHLEEIHGILVVATKAHANASLAAALQGIPIHGPVVLLQNGLDVEEPFLHPHFGTVCRSILYVTSQTLGRNEFSFRSIQPSPIGLVQGAPSALDPCVAALDCDAMPFRAEPSIQREAWRKTLVNAVFNTVGPLLETDNGVFARNEDVATLARDLIGEGVRLAQRIGYDLDEEDLMQQVLRISSGSRQFISTLQDIREGRETEIDFLNLAIARKAASLHPPVGVPMTELLGRLVRAKSDLHRQAR